jgi:hypothetical protein
MPEYCDHRDKDGSCNAKDKECTLAVDRKGMCEIGDLTDYIGTSYKVRDILCPRLSSPINLDPEGDD